MDNTIVIAIITAISTVFAQFLMSKGQHDKEQAVLEERQNQIIRRLDEHNGYAQKLADITTDMAEIKTSVAVMQKDIEYLRKGTQI